jgi:hypothetical protein
MIQTLYAHMNKIKIKEKKKRKENPWCKQEKKRMKEESRC